MKAKNKSNDSVLDSQIYPTVSQSENRKKQSMANYSQESSLKNNLSNLKEDGQNVVFLKLNCYEFLYYLPLRVFKMTIIGKPIEILLVEDNEDDVGLIEEV